MEINVTARLPKSVEKGCQLVFLYSDGKLKGSAKKIDAESNQAIQNVFKANDFTGSCAQTLLMYGMKGGSAERVMLVGLGNHKQVTKQQWMRACQAAATAVVATKASIALSDCLTSTQIDSLSTKEQALTLSREIVNANYAFTLHSGKKAAQERSLTKILFSASKDTQSEATLGGETGVAIANGMNKAKDLGNLAPNICTPEYLATQATQLDIKFERISTSVLEESDMKELGMGALLSVSSGSRQAAKLIVMNYQGRKRAGSPIILVGKGVTFDTGGISIKPAATMDEMKFDRGGAASVFGAMQSVAELQLDANVIGIVAAAENMPDGNASRPGDVVTSMSGQSIEILNTDAEGRLVLCDALTYAKQFKPSAIIDIATLTGACVVALGDVASAVMGNHQPTVDALITASESSGDHCWQLPIWDDYQQQLDSNFADMANIGGPKAGAITAACFLSRFADSLNWAHLDIAGTGWKSGSAKGATGRPVPLLVQFILDQNK